MLKLSDNPPALSPLGETVSQLPGKWWIAHTKARAEKAFAWDLLRSGIGYFLPLLPRVTFSGGRKRQVLKPLFPSYVFFCGDDTVRYRALLTDRLCSAIPVADQPKLLDELSMLELALAQKVELDLYPFAAVGRRCRITAGPFMGMHGIVLQRTKRTTLILQVSMLGQGAAMEVDLDLLEAVEEPDQPGSLRGS